MLAFTILAAVLTVAAFVTMYVLTARTFGHRDAAQTVAGYAATIAALTAIGLMAHSLGWL